MDVGTSDTLELVGLSHHEEEAFEEACCALTGAGGVDFFANIETSRFPLSPRLEDANVDG